MSCINSTNLKLKFSTEKNDILSHVALSIFNSKNSNDNQINLNKKITLFFARLEISSRAESTCNSKIIQSSSQAKMRMLKSVISNCPGYCRIGMDSNGVIDGARYFSLESKKTFILILFLKIKLEKKRKIPKMMILNSSI